MEPEGPAGRLGTRMAVAVFLVFAFAYFLSALLRAVTATLAPVLVAEFALHARDLGLLAGGYFLGFAAMQLPMGRWLDRHGPRAVVLAFSGLAVAGCAVFALADGFGDLLLGRVLCGAGVSACLMAPLTGFRRWMSPAAQLRANAWMLMTGSLGMVASTLPVQWLLPLTGWRPMFGALGLLVVLAALLIARCAPRWDGQDSRSAADAPERPGGPDAPPPGYAAVWRHPYFRRLAPLGFFTYGGMVAVQTLWAGPWLQRVAGYSPLEAATGLFTINLAMLCAFWTWGMVNPWLLRRLGGADPVMAAMLPVPLAVLAGIVIAGEAAGAAAWALYCVTTSCITLSQPALAMAFPQGMAGRVLSAFNLVMFLGVFCVQWGIGLAVDAFVTAGWPESSAFRATMAAYGACSALAYAWFLVRGRRHNAVHPITP
ncbi:Predicted arabinose efflux permease, MFS family [Paracidovorax konjaci]|uniref:Predicted arabinose efflux permease, MFS family n=2 Tax=Paracidovorax konjaci TaxID=32040 RepID=A0A1I1Z8E5_9BURK|nr:Predicted arabinose efflux permease, MFS family [Paracidovorax konjaci]